MAQKTKIKSDFLGLYVLAGGYISRPFYGTIFNDGDVVKTNHFNGSSLAGVTYLDKNIINPEDFEMWSTTGISNVEYNKLSNAEIEEKTNWYKSRIPLSSIYINRNTDFKNKYNYNNLIN